MSLDEQVGLEIHTRMFQRKIPQTKMSERMGITQAALSKKVHGERPWYLKDIYSAAAVDDAQSQASLRHATLWRLPL